MGQHHIRVKKSIQDVKIYTEKLKSFVSDFDRISTLDAASFHLQECRCANFSEPTLSLLVIVY